MGQPTSVPRSKPTAPSDPAQASLDRLRTAFRFNLWTWALYWPGGGLILLLGGLDWKSMVFMAATGLQFAFLLGSGALRANSSRNMKEFFLERPLYLVGALVVFMAFGPIFGFLENVGLLLYAGLWVASYALIFLRLRDHLHATKQGIWASRADQVVMLAVLGGGFALLVFLDALLPYFNGATTQSPLALVATVTWVSLAYPALLLLATRPFREPLQRPRWLGGAKRSKAPAPVPARARASPQPMDA